MDPTIVAAFLSVGGAILFLLNLGLFARKNEISEMEARIIRSTVSLSEYTRNHNDMQQMFSEIRSKLDRLIEIEDRRRNGE